MTPLLKKQEEKDLQTIRELLRLPDNKLCFDCCAKSPFFVDMTTQTFICARCSGLVREVGHRVKSISTSKFSGPETMCLELGGNGLARRIWLHGYNYTSTEWIESDYDIRLFMRQKYYELRWFDRSLWNEHGDKVKKALETSFTEDGIRRNTPCQRLSVKTSSPTFILPPPPSSPNAIQQRFTSLDDDDCPLGLTAAANQFVPIQRQSPSLIDDEWMQSTITPTTTNSKSFDMSSITKPIQPLAPPPPPSLPMQSPTKLHHSIPSPTTLHQSPSPTRLQSPISYNTQSPSTPTDPFAALRGLSF
ncbi:hypothetical protein BC941DRAFT_444003 [Chlamydoabsidia padenii]|nr:hypothetical protein BC941DRAFT_444003 [Chlamydoabsidia padenii]